MKTYIAGEAHPEKTHYTSEELNDFRIWCEEWGIKKPTIDINSGGMSAIEPGPSEPLDRAADEGSRPRGSL